MVPKKYTAAILAELIGTFLLTLTVLTVSKSSLNLPFFVSLSAGLVLVSMTLAFGRLSGAQLNPAITLGLFSVRKLNTYKTAAYIIAQLIGGLAAYYLFSYFSGQKWHNAGHYEPKLLVAEMIGAFLFSFGWATVVFQKLETGKAAAVVGVSFMLALLAMSSAGVVILNPAVALGLRQWVWTGSVLGPVLGSLAGFQIYKLMFATEIIQPKTTTTPEQTDNRKSTPQTHRVASR